MSQKNLKAFLFCVCVFGSNASVAYFESSTNPEKAIMNDITFADYSDFTKKWHLVTVRFREDTQEMRFTYANDQAWAEMNKLKPEYSDGAVFAKVGLMSEKDPAFPSSIVPSGAKRYQFMVKNSKKYESTKGWGYALFDQGGHLFNEDVKAKTLACAACHAVVPERDYVFSRPMDLHFDSAFPKIVPSQYMDKYIKFTGQAVTGLPLNLQKLLPKKLKSVDSAEGEVKKNLFSGTLDEIIPFLMENSRKSGQTSVLVLDAKNFTVVTPSIGKKGCDEKKISFHISVLYNDGMVRDIEVCK